MCRGCDFLSGGKDTVYEYLQWLDKYHAIGSDMKRLEAELSQYIATLDKPEHKKAVDRFRRKIIKLRRELNAAEKLLNIEEPKGE